MKNKIIKCKECERRENECNCNYEELKRVFGGKGIIHNRSCPKFNSYKYEK